MHLLSVTHARSVHADMWWCSRQLGMHDDSHLTYTCVVQENYFFDGDASELNAKRVVLRVRLYGVDKKAVVTCKARVSTQSLYTSPVQSFWQIAMCFCCRCCTLFMSRVHLQT